MARRIQSESVRGLGAKLLLGGVDGQGPYELLNFLFPNFFSRHLFLTSIFSSIFLESSKTYAKKIIEIGGKIIPVPVRIWPRTFAPIFMKDAHSVESNEIWIFRFFLFLFFELIVFTIKERHTGILKYHQPKKKIVWSGQIYRKDTQWADTDDKSILRFVQFLFS